MANATTGFGFRPIGLLEGGAPTFGISHRPIASSYATAIYKGDVVMTVSNTGYMQQATASTTQIHGVFQGCKYFSIAAGRTVWSPYWPGTADATGDIDAEIIDNPNAIFEVRTSSSAVLLANVGNNCAFVINTGVAAGGISRWTADSNSLATTATLPFKVVGLSQITGNDNTLANNIIVVTFNNQDFKVTGGL